MSISENIFRIMNERHISQKEFAKMINSRCIEGIGRGKNGRTVDC